MEVIKDGKQNIKQEIADKYNCNVSEVKCSHCKYWGYNKGKNITNSNRSYCSQPKQKRYTNNVQYCSGFEPIEDN